MTQKDQRGLAMTGASARAAELYEQALWEFRCYVEDPLATMEQAIEDSPGFVLGHAYKAALYLLSTEAGGFAPGRAALDAAAALPANERESGHVAALQHLAAGHWHEAGRAFEEVTIAHPTDLMALQCGQLIDFYTGEARTMRDRIARARPAWSPSMTGYHGLLSLAAFGLEEAGHYAEAEAAGREAVALEPRDGWGQHAVAHVLEMQCRTGDGIAWMRADTEAWSRNSIFAVHNWWHLGLFHLELGEMDEVLALFDGPIFGARSTVMLDLIDASAMLWRLELRGLPVGQRWQELADLWLPAIAGNRYAFNDIHAMMAFVGAGRTAAQRQVIEALEAQRREDDDNGRIMAPLGEAVARGLMAFGQEDYAGCLRHLRPVRNHAGRFGGSHAQRDVIDLTMIEAALRGGDAGLARALVNERAARRPESPLTRLMATRVAGQMATIAA